jgi:hypothetical protein
LLFVGKGEKDAVVYGHCAREERRCAGIRQSNVPGRSGDRRTRRLFVRRRCIAGLERDARRSRRALRLAEARVADKDLAETAVQAGTCVCGRLTFGFVGSVAGCYRKKRDKSS